MAKKFVDIPLRSKPQRMTARQDVVEHIELSDNESEETVQQNEFDGLVQPDLLKRLKIKQERIGLLENTVKNLNSRIGTETLRDADSNDLGSSSTALSHYKKNPDVNTLHMQTDETFGKGIYFITDVITLSYNYMMNSIHNNILCISEYG